jgi:hypothetical protein
MVTVAAGIEHRGAWQAAGEGGVGELVRCPRSIGETHLDAGIRQHDQRPFANGGNHQQIDLLGFKPPGQATRLVFRSVEAADSIEQAMLPLAIVKVKLTGRTEMLAERTSVHGDRNADGLRGGVDGCRGTHFVMSVCPL